METNKLGHLFQIGDILYTARECKTLKDENNSPSERVKVLEIETWTLKEIVRAEDGEYAKWYSNTGRTRKTALHYSPEYGFWTQEEASKCFSVKNKQI